MLGMLYFRPNILGLQPCVKVQVQVQEELAFFF